MPTVAEKIEATWKHSACRFPWKSREVPVLMAPLAEDWLDRKRRLENADPNLPAPMPIVEFRQEWRWAGLHPKEGKIFEVVGRFENVEIVVAEAFVPYKSN